MTEHIRSEHRDHILTLTFARPDKKNAIPTPCMARSPMRSSPPRPIRRHA